ncbi:MAG: hypothetical protein GC151_16530 [Betaproteobacteria bacterium]|nr:hypothetical protein [Betaproteobacteria bacterium]
MPWLPMPCALPPSTPLSVPRRQRLGETGGATAHEWRRDRCASNPVRGRAFRLIGHWDDPSVTEKLDLGLFDKTGTRLIQSASAANGLIFIANLATGENVVAVATNASFDPACSISIQASVQEPGTTVLTGSGLAGILLARHRSSLAVTRRGA